MKDIDGHSPRFSDMVNGEKIEAELYIRRMPLSDCSPQDEKACAEFVHKLYREKVRFLKEDFNPNKTRPKIEL